MKTKQIFIRAGLAAIFSLGLFACSGDEAPVETPEAEVAEGAVDPAAAEGEAKKEEAAAKEEVVALPARRFLEVDGKVTLDGADATVGMVIPAEALIKTTKKAHAVITLKPGSVIEIGAKSEVKFSTGEANKLSAQLVLGSLWNFFPSGADYEVKTNNAVAGIRGTDFFVEAPKKNMTYICACSGDVQMTGANKKKFDKTISSPNNDHKGFMFKGKGKKTKAKKAKRHGHEDARAAELMTLLETTKVAAPVKAEAAPAAVEGEAAPAAVEGEAAPAAVEGEAAPAAEEKAE